MGCLSEARASCGPGKAGAIAPAVVFQGQPDSTAGAASQASCTRFPAAFEARHRASKVEQSRSRDVMMLAFGCSNFGAPTSNSGIHSGHVGDTLALKGLGAHRYALIILVRQTAFGFLAAAPAPLSLAVAFAGGDTIAPCGLLNPNEPRSLESSRIIGLPPQRWRAVPCHVRARGKRKMSGK
jgi:hypothetical protein